MDNENNSQLKRHERNAPMIFQPRSLSTLSRHGSALMKGTVVSALALMVYFWSEDAIGSEKALTDSLEKVSTLTTGAVAKTGLTVTTIIGTIAAAAKHSVGLAAIVMGMGVALSYYLTYLKAWGT
jgi:type IV secretory pathway VirB2 component (pilin)